ncbi:MAG TPA: hypothetical protein DCZ40_12880 [Lachnospiraceae bacterium]|nr:hypothetical protein [Lachnospiraceae bacterium]
MIYWSAAVIGYIKDKIGKICPHIKIDRVESEIVKFFDIIILLDNRFPQRHGRLYGIGCRNGRQSDWLCGRCGLKAKAAYFGGNGYDRDVCSNRRDGTVKKPILDDRLIYEILSVVEEIPEGCVATYGQIACLIGREKNARLVGKVLSNASYYGEYPCHRVVNHAGRLVPGWQEQSDLLAQEGVFLKDNGNVDLTRYQWDCE